MTLFDRYDAMKKTANLYFIVTTMDGVPVTKNDATIMQYISTQAMRNAAKHLTFTTRQRHHTWWLTKDKRFRAKKQFERHGFIPLGMLE